MVQCPGIGYFKPTGTCIGGGGNGNGTGTTTPRPGGTTDTCPTGQVQTIIQADGFELPGADDVTFPAQDEQACFDFCNSNAVLFHLRVKRHKQMHYFQDDIGTPFQCTSFEYNFDTLQCTMSSSSAAPFGPDAELSENPAVIYGAKVCLSGT